jgi:hypothetical protein
VVANNAIQPIPPAGLHGPEVVRVFGVFRDRQKDGYLTEENIDEEI